MRTLTEWRAWWRLPGPLDDHPAGVPVIRLAEGSWRATSAIGARSTFVLRCTGACRRVGSGGSTRLEEACAHEHWRSWSSPPPPVLASPVSAQRAPGGVTIYDSIGCSKDVRAAKVTVPFSIGVTGLAPNSSTEIFVTDKDAQPDIVYGPGTFTADENGNICLDIFDAPAGTWKIDVVEQGSGFTDSKVFTVEETETPPITLPSTTTTTTGTTTPPATTTPTTLAPPTTPEHDHHHDHHDGAATTPTTTTTAPPTTPDHHHDHVAPPTTPESTTPTTTADNVARVDNAPPTTTPTTPAVTPPDTEPGSVTRPFDELPWVLQQVEAGSAASIPGTGGTGAVPVGAVAMILVGLGGLVIVTTRRRGRPEAL